MTNMDKDDIMSIIGKYNIAVDTDNSILTSSHVCNLVINKQLNNVLNSTTIDKKLKNNTVKTTPYY